MNRFFIKAGRKIFFLLPVLLFLLPLIANESSIRLLTTNDLEQLPTALQTPIIHFQGIFRNQIVSVDLFGAVHFAEASYYQELNNRFRNYETVCVEMVHPEGKTLQELFPERSYQEKENHPTNPGQLDPLTAIQSWMGEKLKLSFQLDEIDYRQPNLLLADITEEELLNEFGKEGELNETFRQFCQTLFEDYDRPEENLPPFSLSLGIKKFRRLLGRVHIKHRNNS